MTTDGLCVWGILQCMRGYCALKNVFISHETIYKYIRRDKSRGGVLYKNCRHHLKYRKRTVTGKRIAIPNRTSISERPQEADGERFGDFEIIAKALDTKVYFADPYASWQKGAIENQNGLIRQYIPKGTDFKEYSHQKITKIMHKINMRPREKLKFATPAQCFYEKIA